MVVASIHGPFGGILDHDCGVRGVVRMLSARREDVSICRSPPRPAFRWRVWRPFNEREPAGVLPRKLAEEEKMSILVGTSIPCGQSKNAQVSHLRAFATPGDSVLLKSCPFRLPAKRGGSG
jgi:hypothetical protein